MNKILILGGSGFIGSNLAESLVATGEEVIIFDKKEAYYKNLNSISDKVRIVKGDLGDTDIIEKVFDNNKIDIVIHLASSILPATPYSNAAKNKELISTRKLITTMQKKGINKIVFFSSGGAVYGNNGTERNLESSPTKPINFYGQLKLATEEYIQECHSSHGLEYIILRPSNVYGRRQNIYGNQGLIAITFGNLIQQKPIEVWGDGKIIRDYIYITDLCAGLRALIENNKWNDIYNVGTEQGTSINEILQIIKDTTGINFNINYTEGRKVDVPASILNVKKLKNSISWKKPINLKKGIETTWRELKVLRN